MAVLAGAAINTAVESWIVESLPSKTCTLATPPLTAEFSTAEATPPLTVLTTMGLAEPSQAPRVVTKRTVLELGAETVTVRLEPMDKEAGLEAGAVIWKALPPTPR